MSARLANQLPTQAHGLGSRRTRGSALGTISTTGFWKLIAPAALLPAPRQAAAGNALAATCREPPHPHPPARASSLLQCTCMINVFCVPLCVGGVGAGQSWHTHGADNAVTCNTGTIVGPDCATNLPKKRPRRLWSPVSVLSSKVLARIGPSRHNLMAQLPHDMAQPLAPRGCCTRCTSARPALNGTAALCACSKLCSASCAIVYHSFYRDCQAYLRAEAPKQPLLRRARRGRGAERALAACADRIVFCFWGRISGPFPPVAANRLLLSALSAAVE